MQFGMDSLNSISQMLLSRKLKYDDTIIIGDNSSGKSLFLRLLIEKKKEKDDIYFIDAVNRGFDVSKIVKVNTLPEYRNTILSARIEEEYFNLKDSFNCYGTRTEKVEEIYYPLEVKLQDLFEKLTQERFRIIINGILGEVEFKEGKGLLSSGFQAMVRLLLELLYFQEKCVAEKHKERVTVIIDEMDEFLSPGYAYKIFPFIKKYFSQMDLIVTTHSSDLVLGAQNANLVVLGNLDYEVMDVNDYQSASEVQIIFDRVFGIHLSLPSEVERELRRLLNNRINNAWTKKEQLQLEKLQKEQLTASQRLICRQIMEW